VAIMGIVELSVADPCHPIKPKFGVDGMCLFYGKLDKFVWLLGPILVMLMINTFMFSYIAVMVFRQQRKMTASKHGGSIRGELLDKMVLYLRLFFGMGIIWYFEVISFYYGGEWSTVTDVINMMQGVWVFLTFVCKKNVLQVILRKRDRLYSAVLQRSRSKSNATTLQPESASNLNKDRKKVISLRTEELSLTSGYHEEAV